jgi:hypothetical protein
MQAGDAIMLQKNENLPGQTHQHTTMLPNFMGVVYQYIFKAACFAVSFYHMLRHD